VGRRQAFSISTIADVSSSGGDNDLFGDRTELERQLDAPQLATATVMPGRFRLL